MSKKLEYDLKESITVEMLNELGFINDRLGCVEPIEVDEDGTFEAIRAKDGIAVTASDLTYYGKGRKIRAYTYKGLPQGHKKLKDIDPLPYIQDLIELMR